MFRNTTLSVLTSEQIYLFPRREPIYLDLLDLYELLDIYLPYLEDTRDPAWTPGPRLGLEMDWERHAFTEVHPNLPLVWLAHAKWALCLGHVPIDFHAWALVVLGRFDLSRYQRAYRLEAQELDAITQDHELVLDALRVYPGHRLKAPIGALIAGPAPAALQKARAALLVG